MTIFLPLEASSPFPQSPSFLIPPTDLDAQVTKVIKTILKAKRIVIVCGAGISVQAGIPDFRSPEGLFQTLKRDNPRESLASGKDLFDASVFSSEHSTSLFCQMIARLSELSQAAEPTPFHRVLRALDDHGRLLRVYTQNIDAIERKSGLSFGVPEFEGKRSKPRSKGKSNISLQETPDPDQLPSLPVCRPHDRLPSPPAETPRCIPLHGTLQTLHCQTCTHSFPLEDYLPSLTSGTPPRCPECTALEETRQLVGKRARGVGKLRPSVVLYNETHKDGEGVGEVVRKDLVGSSKGKGRTGADLLLVVGTSLRVPGTKRIVREFAKAVHSRASSKDPTTGLFNPSPSPRRSPATDEEPRMKTMYLNLDFPVPTREWEGVFDVWLQGDAQAFAQMLHDELRKDDRTKELLSDKRRKREEEAALTLLKEREAEERARLGKIKGKGQKRKSAPGHVVSPAKRQKLNVTPRSQLRRNPKSVPTRLLATPRQDQKSSTHQKIILRIPARPPLPSCPSGKRLVPEVYIATTPSIPRKPFAKLQAPPTPATTPPRPSRHKTTTKDSRRVTSISSSPRAVKKDGVRSYEVPTDFNDSEDGPGELTDLLVRTIQYGLRGS